MGKEKRTWPSSFAHKDVDNAAAGELLVWVYQFTSNADAAKVLRKTSRSGKDCCRSCAIAAPHDTPQYERDQRERISVHPTLATVRQSSSWQGTCSCDAHGHLKPGKSKRCSWASSRFPRSSTLRLVSMATRLHIRTRVLEHIRTTSAILGRSTFWAFFGGFTLLAVILAVVNVAALLGRRSLCRRGKPVALHLHRPGARSESHATKILNLIVHCSENVWSVRIFTVDFRTIC